MIVIKGVPGLTTPDVMSAIADIVPLDQVTTGYGGIVVDERTALTFLQRYLTAVDGSPAPTEEEEDIINVDPAPSTEESTKPRTTRRGR